MVLQSLIFKNPNLPKWPDNGSAIRMKSFCYCLLFLFLSGSAFAQKRVEIKDPDLKFSYILPAGWKSVDEELYHKIAYSDNSALVSLTYFEGKCPDLNDCYLGEIEALKAASVNALTIEANGSEMIDGNLAYWFHYSSKSEEGQDYHGYMYLFIWNDQFFQIQAVIQHKAFQALNEPVLDIIRSLKVSKK